MKQLLLNKEQEQVILGSLFGDGSLIKRRGTYEFAMSNSKKQKEYLYWKNNFLNFPLYEYEIRDQVTVSKTSKNFEKFFNLFPNKEKVQIDKLLNSLSNLGIAIWFIDDGNYNYGSSSVTLATCYFTKSQNIKIINWFKKKKGITFQLKTINTKGFTNKQNKKYFILSTDKCNAIKFLKLIKPITKIMPNIIQYKLGTDEVKRLRTRDSKNKYQKKYYQKYFKKGN